MLICAVAEWIQAAISEGMETEVRFLTAQQCHKAY